MTDRSRRDFILLSTAVAMAAGLTPFPTWASAERMIRKPIGSSSQRIPIVGMGTWQTFNVGSDQVLISQRTQVLARFFELGGGLVDSSPMYGSSGAVLGKALKQLGLPATLFSADKVWTADGDSTARQLQQRADAWQIKRFDLMQVHNLLNWRDHLPKLLAMKAAGELGFVGVTTSHGRRLQELEQIMQQQPLDFVQLTYNISHREVEQRLLPLAQEKGIAVIANRPFDGGSLIRTLKRKHSLPPLAAQCDCSTWADFLLKFILSHPAVTCAIPATTQVKHMTENMKAGYGTLPTAKQRQQMIRVMEDL